MALRSIPNLEFHQPPKEVLAATAGSSLDYVPEPVEKWHATERWEIDRPQGEIAMSLVNFNNRLVWLVLI